MANKQENPPVFPYLEKSVPELGCFPKLDIQHSGMTLRDYFAGQALIGICAARISEQDMHDIADRVKGGKFYTNASYALADAMLKTREAINATS